MKQEALEVLRKEFPDLVQWLEPLCRYNKLEDFIQVDYKKIPRHTTGNDLFLTMYTKDNQYNIHAYPKHNEEESGYLGCTVTTRKPRAGEDWTRGNDLADGGYTKEIWDRILNNIISYELVKVAKPKHPEVYLDSNQVFRPSNDSSSEKNYLDKK